MKCNTSTAQFVTMQESCKLEMQNTCETKLFLPCNPTPAQWVAAAQKVTPVIQNDIELANALQRLGKGQLDYVVITNVPIDSTLCDPPENGMRPVSKLMPTSEITALGLMQAAGLTPLSYREEKGDQLVHEVAPSPHLAHTKSNAGKVELGMHSDNSILEAAFRPEFLLLLALINDAATGTRIAPALEAFMQLSPRHQELLTGANYRVQTPDSFDKAFNNKKILSEFRPIITFDDAGGIKAAGNLYAVAPKNKAARIALEAFNEALIDVSREIILHPGMALIFNNEKVFHGRGEIKTGKRWLQRVFGKIDLTALRNATQSTPMDYIFSVRQLICNFK